MFEVELKIRISEGMKERLLSSIFESVVRENSKTETDEYFDTPSFQFFKRGVFLRVRNGRKFELKFDAAAQTEHGDCVEVSHELPLSGDEMVALNSFCARYVPNWVSAETFAQAKEANDLRLLAVIAKKRERYRVPDASLCFDDVEGLGSFAEIEFVCATEEEAERARMRIAKIRQQLMVAPVGEGYVELWLKTNNPELYKLGVYQAG